MEARTPANPASVKASVHGLVKGIGFRAFVVAHAQALKLTGYVRNVPGERTVELEAEGEKANLEKLVARFKVGPPLARVEGVDVEWVDYSGKYSEFSVRG